MNQIKLGDMYVRGADPDPAVGYYEAALTVARKLAAKQPDVTSWQIDLLLALWRNAEQKFRLSNLNEARGLFTEALAIAEKLKGESKLLAPPESEWPKILHDRLTRIAK